MLRAPIKPWLRSRADRWGRGVRLSLLAPLVLAIVLLTAGCGSSPSPSSAADSLVSQGLQAESAGQFHLAATDFHSAVAADGSDAVPYYELGALYQRLHDSPQAANEYKHALSIDPKYNKAMFHLAVVDTPMSPQAAMNLYNELLLRNPKDARVEFNLGLLLISQLQPTPGHELLKRAVALDPSLVKKLPTGITP